MIASTVYPPAEDSFLMLEAMRDYMKTLDPNLKTQDPKHKTVDTRFACSEPVRRVVSRLVRRRPKTVKTALDMGTGSGILAIELAKLGFEVTAADINPEAIKIAKQNTKEAGVKIDFVISDLFSNIRNKFDLIVFNPPYVKTEDRELKTADMEALAWAGGPDGMQVINRFLSGVSSSLKPEGRIILLVSSNDDKIPELPGYTIKLLKRKSLFFEQLFVLELS